MEEHGTCQHLNAISLDHLSVIEIADLLNRGYEGYAVPIRFTAETLVRRILADHVDLTRSLAFLDISGRPLGCILMSRRGRKSRVAALGIAPAARGRGVGRQAVEKVTARAKHDGDERIVLEVLSDNLPARRLYDTAGFVPRRTLVGYERMISQDHSAPDPIEECEAETVLAELLASYPEDVTWQVSPLSFTGATAPVRGFRSRAGAVCLVEPALSGVRLLAIAVPWDKRGRGHGRALLASLTTKFPGKTWHVPAFVPEDLADRFFISTGWRRTSLTQVEMELAL